MHVHPVRKYVEQKNAPGSLTFELIEDANGLNDITSVGKNLNDVVLHGAHHAEPRLMTCMNSMMSSVRKNTYSFQINSIFRT